MKEPSYMIIIPGSEKDIESPETFMNNLSRSGFISITDMSMKEEEGMLLELIVDDKPYKVVVDIADVEVPSFIRPEHFFSQEEINKIDETHIGLSVCMDYDEDPLRCFYDQIRIIHAMLPDVLAVMDCPAEKIISGRWVALAAGSEVLPAPRYLFSVQAVSDDEEIWLHSHGLKRCGLYELEILCSDREICNEHYKMIETFACRMLDNIADGQRTEPGEGVYLGEAAGYDMVLTAVDWREALTYYPEAKLGTGADREDEYHSEDYCVLMMYKKEQDEELKIYTRVQEFNRFLVQNPIFMLSTEETARMRSLAIERIPYMIEGFEKLKPAYGEDGVVLVKIGLTVDDEHQNEEGNAKEHIWFELNDVNEDSIIAKLTQEPYYVAGIKEGDIGVYHFEDITDWIILTKEKRITPDEVYLLEE